MLTYAATTDAVRVSVRPVWIEAQSDALARRHAFAYFVEVTNESDEPVQLLRRHWTIRHADGRTEHVEGDGVVGVQPVIAPGEAHRYHSFCLLTTPTGTMEGTYLMERPSGERLRVVIPRFDLVAGLN